MIASCVQGPGPCTVILCMVMTIRMTAMGMAHMSPPLWEASLLALPRMLQSMLVRPLVRISVLLHAHAPDEQNPAGCAKTAQMLLCSVH